MKRVFCMILSVLFVFSLFGCNRSSQDDLTDKTLQPIAVDHVWKSDYITYPENVRGTPNPYTIDGNQLLYEGVRVISEEPYKTESVSIAFDLKEHTFSVTPSGGEQQSRAQFTLSYEGSTICLYITFDETTRKESYTLIRKDADGNILWEIDAQAQFQKLAGGRPWFSVQSLLQNPETGTIYIAAEQNIVAISPDGKRLFELVSDEYIDNIFASDSAVYVVTNQHNPEDNSLTTVFLPINDNKQNFDEPLPIPATVDLLNADIYQADGFDLFYSNDVGLFGWNTTDMEPTMLCNWVNSDMTARDRSSLIVLSASSVVRTAYDPVSGAQQLCVMSPVPQEEVTPKYLITVAYIENGSNDMQAFAVAFNRESEQYRVVLKDYSQYYMQDNSAADILNREIVAGDVPDIIVDSAMEFDTVNLAKKGLFLDLNTYLDASNAAVTRDAFLPCVLEPFELSDGNLPWLVSGFTLRTIYANQNVIGDRQVWSLDDIMTLEETLSDEQYLFSMYLGGNRENGSMQLLNKLIPYSMSAFVDTENGTCAFDDGRFANLLYFCHTVNILDTATVPNGIVEKFRDGTLLLREMSYLSEIASYLKTKYYDFGGENMTVIGYPTADAEAVSGTAIHPLRKYCITKDSLVADGAWQFILSTFGDLGVDYFYHVSGFPSMRSALDRMFAQESRSYYVFRENGYSSTSVSEGEEFILEDQEWLADEISSGGVFGHLSEEDEAELRAMIESVSITTEFDQEIMNLIREDASAYFAGAKSLEETVKVIQSRVSIYVAEQS